MSAVHAPRVGNQSNQTHVLLVRPTCVCMACDAATSIRDVIHIGEERLMKDYMKTLRTPPAKLGAILMVIALVLGACSGGGAKPTTVTITEPSPGTAINVGQG